MTLLTFIFIYMHLIAENNITIPDPVSFISIICIKQLLPAFPVTVEG
jgi:hypothetical protein